MKTGIDLELGSHRHPTAELKGTSSLRSSSCTTCNAIGNVSAAHLQEQTDRELRIRRRTPNKDPVRDEQSKIVTYVREVVEAAVGGDRRPAIAISRSRLRVFIANKSRTTWLYSVRLRRCTALSCEDSDAWSRAIDVGFQSTGDGSIGGSVGPRAGRPAASSRREARPSHAPRPRA